MKRDDTVHDARKYITRKGKLETYARRVFRGKFQSFFFSFSDQPYLHREYALFLVRRHPCWFRTNLEAFPLGIATPRRVCCFGQKYLILVVRISVDEYYLITGPVETQSLRLCRNSAYKMAVFKINGSFRRPPINQLTKSYDKRKLGVYTIERLASYFIRPRL